MTQSKMSANSGLGDIYAGMRRVGKVTQKRTCPASRVKDMWQSDGDKVSGGGAVPAVDGVVTLPDPDAATASREASSTPTVMATSW